MQTAPPKEAQMIEELPATTSGDRLPLALALVAISILAGSSIFYWVCHPMMIFPDQGLYVHMAELFLQGKVPYVDMFEINPPLAIYLHVAPVLAARLFHITEPLAFSLYIWGLILLSSIAGGVAVWRSGSRGALYVGMAAILGFVYFSQCQILDFGQRDHVFAILYFPFFIVRYLRWQGLKVDRSLAILVGIMAGLGIALKHYFLLVAIAPEIVWALDKRTVWPCFRAETAATAMTILLYVVHFFFLPKAELQTYFGFIVPIYQAGYTYYMTSMSYNLLCSRGDFYVMALTTLGALVLARQSSFVLPLQAFSLMSAVIFVLAGQVWPCHTVSTRMASDMAIAVQALLFAGYLPAFIKRRRSVHIALGLALIIFAANHVNLSIRDAIHDQEEGEGFWASTVGHVVNSPSSDIDPCTRIVLEHTTKDDSILFISSAMAPGYPVFLQTGRRPGSRFLHGMVLPILGSLIESPEEASPDLDRKRMKQVLDWYRDDIATNKPKLIFVQIRFIYDALKQRGFFEQQMAGYYLLQTEGDYRVYLREH